MPRLVSNTWSLFFYLRPIEHIIVFSFYVFFLQLTTRAGKNDKSKNSAEDKLCLSLCLSLKPETRKRKKLKRSRHQGMNSVCVVALESTTDCIEQCG